jgi:Asp/Glu/hydantoin racemase
MMFYEHAAEALDSTRSEGWLVVAKELQMSPRQLQTHIENESLSFEQCIQLVKSARSPELLAYVLSQFDPSLSFMKSQSRFN